MKELICIVCPKGCHLLVDEEKRTVCGNGCKRGVEYGIREVTAPTRVVTTTVCIHGAIHSRLPVKTSQPIPKGLVMELMDLVNTLEVQAPVKIGDVIAADVPHTGVDLVACKHVDLMA